MLSKIVKLVAVVMLISSTAVADDFSEASAKWCEKIKSCVLQQMSQGDMPPGVREQIMQSLGGTCLAAQQQFRSAAMTTHPMYQPATRCMNSLATLSCAEFENLDENKTPECEKYEAMAESYR